MKILIENGCHHLKNLGDIAMLQVAIGRLTAVWPDCEISVVAEDPELLGLYCPDTHFVPARGHDQWFKGSLLGRLARVAPKPISDRVRVVEERARRMHPELMSTLLQAKMQLRGDDSTPMNEFIRALLDADAVVVSGGGDLTEAFAPSALTLLSTLNIAKRAGKVAAMFGQGVGPINDPDSALPGACRGTLLMLDLIGLREQRAGPRMLAHFGVDLSRSMVTGDDAIELAYERRRTTPGAAIGVSLRMSSYSGVKRPLVTELRYLIHRAAATHRARLLPAPISLLETESDLASMEEVLADGTHATNCWNELRTPEQVVDQTGLCRLVVTGTYHAAVFALSQGIPAVCLARSQYYKDKFLGLADQFRAGCEVVNLDEHDFRERTARAIDRAWENADGLREDLLSAARRQIEVGRHWYARLGEARNDISRARPPIHSTPSAVDTRKSAALARRTCNSIKSEKMPRV